MKVTPALAYFRTSSATNVGPDRDSEKRQHEAVAAFARRAGYEIEAEFYDAAVSGADPVDARPGFAALLARIAGATMRNTTATITFDFSFKYPRHGIYEEANAIFSRVARTRRVGPVTLVRPCANLRRPADLLAQKGEAWRSETGSTASATMS